MVWTGLLRHQGEEGVTTPPRIRCAVYTRKSSEEGLEQSFNSLHAQREACEAFIRSQRHEGWQLIATEYDDGGFSGGTMERPALKKLMADIAAKRIDTVLVYKVDRLTRSLMDFARIVEQFDKQGISFVSVTQQFNTTTSMGRLTLNVLLSFAQFEREVTGERIRDKIAASKQKGMWMGGVVPIGYDLQDRHLLLHPEDAEQVRNIYRLYIEAGSVTKLREVLEQKGIRSKKRVSRTGRASGGLPISRGALYELLQNRIYRGEITHKGISYPGKQPAIIDQKLWDQVQDQLKANLQAPMRRPRATEQSLLMGMLYDDKGNRFTPSHTNKKGQRYRYYVSQAIIKNPGKGSSGPVRMPAQEIEDLVVSQLTSLLQSPQNLLDLFGTAQIEQLVRASREWTNASSEKMQAFLKSAVRRVAVRKDSVQILLSRAALREAMLGPQDVEPLAEQEADDFITLEASAQLTRRGGEMRLQLSPDAPGSKPRPDTSLVRAVARAHDWVERILRGDTANQRSIAAETGHDERYISRILPLAFLAPDLMEDILEGKQLPYLSLDIFRGRIPIDWTQQRVTFAES
jgi:DNA invertase Pin-like site-specific DNA recombinase